MKWASHAKEIPKKKTKKTDAKQEKSKQSMHQNQVLLTESNLHNTKTGGILVKENQNSIFVSTANTHLIYALFSTSTHY